MECAIIIILWGKIFTNSQKELAIVIEVRFLFLCCFFFFCMIGKYNHIKVSRQNFHATIPRNGFKLPTHRARGLMGIYSSPRDGFKLYSKLPTLEALTNCSVF